MLSPSPGLKPLSYLYAAGSSIRNTLYDRGVLACYESSLPVISVGNLTVGGSAKSPFVQYLAENLNARGHKAVILSRGYGGSVRDATIVTPQSDVRVVGDEALMHVFRLGEKAAVVVSPKRTTGARLIESRRLGDFILLDDGFQHRRLNRDENILLIDVSTRELCEAWLEGALLPAGRFRESRQTALARASRIILVRRAFLGSDMAAEDKVRATIPHGKRISVIEVAPSHFRDLHSGHDFGLEAFKEMSASALCAIASPQNFFTMLKNLGIKLSTEYPLADHAKISAANFNAILSGSGGPLFITEKDAVKVKGVVAREGQVFVLVLRISFVEPKDEESLLQDIENLLR